MSWHRTKIVCTLGPATDAPGVLENMIGCGMDMARMNMSHGTHAEHAGRIQRIRTLSRQTGQPITVLADLPGPKFRLGDIAGGSRNLEEGTVVALGSPATAPALLPVRNPELLLALREQESIFLADGAVELRVIGRDAGSVRCEVTIGGTVRSGSGINVPESRLGAIVPTEADRRHLTFALDQGAEWVAVSFVQSADDLARVRACFGEERRPLLMAKIEKRRALSELDAIVAAADAVMVARGDLGVETDLAEIALVQKRIIAAANSNARPVVTATQMLESMIDHERPTRAEVTDVANAVLDGTDAVMLSGETAIGRHPAAAVAMLDRVLRATEVQPAAGATRELQQGKSDPLGEAAAQLASRLGACALVAAVHNFGHAAALASTRGHAPLVLVSDSEAFARSLALIRGVAPVASPTGVDPNSMLKCARDWLYSHQLGRPGDRVVMLASSGGGQGAPDTLQVVALD
jgi:pyruvate kinase